MALIIIQVVITALFLLFVRKCLAIRETMSDPQKPVITKGIVAIALIFSFMPIVGSIFTDMLMFGTFTFLSDGCEDLEWKNKKNSDETSRFVKWFKS